MIQNSNEIKTCFLISSLSGGGAEGVCTTIASGISDAGISTDLVILNAKKSVFQDRLSDRVNLVNLDVQNARYAFYPLIKYLYRSKPNVIITFNYELALVMVLLRPFLFFKCRIIARNINTLSKSFANSRKSFKNSFIRFLTLNLYSKVDHIVNQCEAMKVDLFNVFPDSKFASSVIYNPVNKYIESSVDSDLMLSRRPEQYILCVGRLSAQKSFELAIKAFSVFVLTNPAFRLKIVGVGELEHQLKETASVLGVSEKIDFEGFKTDIYSYYRNASFTLLTSLYEGFPNVLVESIAVGTPIVAVDCPSGPSEIIIEGINGFLVKSRDVNDVSAAMVKAITINWNYLDIRGSARIFSVSGVVQRWKNLIVSN